MSDHSFNPFIAKKYGINEAILINNAIFWTRTNAAKEKNHYDGRYWFYGTPEYFSKYFIYMTERQIQYCLSGLIKSGALLKGNYNKKGYDKTNWYSLSDKLLLELNLDKTCLQPASGLIEQICPINTGAVETDQNIDLYQASTHRTNLSNPSDKFVRPIPDTKPDTKLSTREKERNKNFENNLQKGKVKPNPYVESTFDTSFKEIEEQPLQKTEPIQQTSVYFALFWAMYPKKVGENKCKAQWINDKCDDKWVIIRDKLLEQIEKDDQWKDGYSPTAFTYIVEERWKDQIIKRKHSANNTKQQNKPLKYNYDPNDTSWANQPKGIFK